MKYLKKIEINNSKNETCKADQCLQLIKGSKYEKEFSQLSMDNIRIPGSSELIDLFMEFEDEFVKEDYDYKLNETNFIDLIKENKFNSNHLESYLTFDNLFDQSYVETIYNSKSKYIQLFHIYDLYKACSDVAKKTKYNDEIQSELLEIFKKTYIKNKEILGDLHKKRYRILEHDEKYYLRTIVSNLYFDIDNKASLFISLYLLKKINGVKFIKGYVTDSKIYLVFDGCNPKKIDGIGTISSSLIVTNSELGDHSLTVSIKFKIEKDKKVVYLTPINENKEFKYNNLKITHQSKQIDDVMNTIKTASFDFEKSQADFIELVEKIKDNDLTEKFLENIISKILDKRVKTISDSTRKNVSKIQDKLILIKDLISFFDKINSLEMEFDEKTYLEGIYYQTLKKWKK